jgi:hypothetical protein
LFGDWNRNFLAGKFDFVFLLKVWPALKHVVDVEPDPGFLDLWTCVESQANLI